MIIKTLKKEVVKAFKHDEVPVSALIIFNGRIISKAHNKTVKSHNPIYHAEVIAILKAAKKLKTFNLSQCVLYTALKPCKMCEEIIKASRIKCIKYILESDKIVNNKIIIEKENVNEEDRIFFENKLKTFFKAKR